mgnify:FL=1
MWSGWTNSEMAQTPVPAVGQLHSFQDFSTPKQCPKLSPLFFQPHPILKLQTKFPAENGSRLLTSPTCAVQRGEPT